MLPTLPEGASPDTQDHLHFRPRSHTLLHLQAEPAHGQVPRRVSQQALLCSCTSVCIRGAILEPLLTSHPSISPSRGLWWPVPLGARCHLLLPNTSPPLAASLRLGNGSWPISLQRAEPNLQTPTPGAAYFETAPQTFSCQVPFHRSPKSPLDTLPCAPAQLPHPPA